MAAPPSFIKQWSTTPASNGTSPNVVPYGWPEGMAPSTVNDTARQQMADHRYQWQDAEWFCWGDSVSKVSGTVFKIATDVTARYQAERRIKIYDTATMYATILSSSYSAPDTSITVQFDNSENSISASFSAVALGIITPTNPSIPRNLMANPNIIIGGDFATNPWQRGTSFTAPVQGTYTADRFTQLNTGTSAVVDVLKTADAPTAAQAGVYTDYCLNFDVTTIDATIAAGDIYGLWYKFEGYNVAKLGFGQSGTRYITLSFWHKHTVTGTWSGSIFNSAQNRSYPFEYTQTTTNTWEKTTVTIPVDTSGTWLYTNGIGLQLCLAIACGSTYQGTVNAWAGAFYCGTANQVNGLSDTSNFAKFALIKLESGSVATPFPIENESEVMDKCQRYYIRYTSTGANSLIFAGGMQSAGNTLAVFYFNPMRSAPTFSYDGTNTNWYVIINSTTIALTGNMTSTGVSSNGNAGINVPCSASVGFASWLAAQTASAWIELSAEL